MDEKGREVPDASLEITFEAEGPGKIEATGSDVSDHIPPAFPVRRMRAGRCSVLVRVGEKAGEIKVRARAEGLLPGCAKVVSCDYQGSRES